VRAWPLRDLRRAARRLRQHAPAGAVLIRRHPPEAPGCGDLGRAHLRACGVGVVSIRADLDEVSGADALAHEWGHVLAWRRHGGDIEAHGPEWGAAYADAYRALGCDL
jgi:hypothetical protein